MWKRIDAVLIIFFKSALPYYRGQLVFETSKTYWTRDKNSTSKCRNEKLFFTLLFENVSCILQRRTKSESNSIVWLLVMTLNIFAWENLGFPFLSLKKASKIAKYSNFLKMFLSQMKSRGSLLLGRPIGSLTKGKEW